MRNDKMFNAGHTLAVVGLMLLAAMSAAASVVVPGEAAKECAVGSREIAGRPVRKVANIVNFVRSLDPRIPHAELERAFEEELKLNEKYGFPNTVLLQYDALIDERMLSVLRRHAIPQPELGLWFEMSRPLCEAAGVPWRGRAGWNWDWHIRPGFFMSYTHEERRALIDTAFGRFRETFGRIPRVVGSWLLDSYSVAYMTERHAIDGVCICREQDATDAYGLRGGYSNGAYYPARRNILSAATDMANAIPVPVFKMLTPDPIYNYGRMAFDPAVGTKPPTLEPVWLSGFTPGTVDWYFRTYTGPGLLNLSYMQLGQENSFGWERISKGLPMQYERLNALWKAGKIEVETFGETARRFRREHARNCPQTQVALEDWSGCGYRSVWYNCRNYRANLFLDKGRLTFRDMHVMRDDFEEPYRDVPCTSWQAEYFTPPVFDEWLYGMGRSAGKAALDGTFKDISAVETLAGDGLAVTAVREDGTTVRIVFAESGVEIRGSSLTVPVPAQIRDSIRLDGSTIGMTFNGYRYRIGAEGRIGKTKDGYVIVPEAGRVTLVVGEK